MRLRLLFAFLLFPVCAMAQCNILLLNVGGACGSLSSLINPGWTFIQDNGWTCSTSSANCTSPANSGNGNFTLPTTAGSVWVAVAATGNTNVTLSASGGGGTWTCPAAAHKFISGTDNVAACYNLTGTTGTSGNFLTTTLSGSPVSYYFVDFIEVLPPSGFTASFDAAGTAAISACTTNCTGASLSPTATDAIVSIVDQNFFGDYKFNSYSSPYITDYDANGICLNCSSGTAPTITFTTSVSAAVVSLAFKSTAGSFSTSSPIFSIANLTQAGTTQSCSPTCSLTVPSVTNGDLLVLWMASNSGNLPKISSASIGGVSFTVPAGCVMTAVGNTTGSCAYLVASGGAGGSTSVSVTLNANSTTVGLGLWEISRTSGSFVIDGSCASTNNAASFTPSGQALTLNGSTVDAIFQGVINPGGGLSETTLYAQPYNWFIIASPNFYANSTVLLNTMNGNAPVYAFPQSSAAATSVAACAFK